MTEANSLNASTVGIVGNKGTSFSGSPTTQYNVLVGGATSDALVNVAPTSLLGIPMVSKGGSTNPAFDTALVVGGGTGVTSFATNGVVISNTTSTGNISAITLTDGQLAIGSSIGLPAAATLTAGTGVTITNGHNSITIAADNGAVVETLTGNSGGAISPTAGNINTVGTGSITTVGSGSTLTTQLTGMTNHNVPVGAGTATLTMVAPTATTGVPLVSNGTSADPSFSTALVAGGGTGSTSFNVNGPVIAGATSTSALTSLIPSSTTGIPLVSQGTGTPVAFSTAVVAGGGTGTTSFTAYTPICAGTTSTGVFQSAATGFATSGFVLTSNGTSALPSWQATADTNSIHTITGNSGGAEIPSAGNFNIVGTGSITVVGSTNTETIQLTGLTSNNVLVGAGGATITKVPPSATAGIPLVSQGSVVDPAFTTAVVAGGGTGATSLTANSLLLGNGTSPVSALGAATNGQLPIGSTSNPPVLATITAGNGITITNGAGSITIDSTTGGRTWTTVTGTSQNMSVNNGYVANNSGQVTLTLPSSASVGDSVAIRGLGAGGWKIGQNASQLIHLGSSVTTTGTGGSLASTNQYDSITLDCIVTNTTWTVASAPQGNITVV